MRSCSAVSPKVWLFQHQKTVGHGLEHGGEQIQAGIAQFAAVVEAAEAEALVRSGSDELRAVIRLIGHVAARQSVQGLPWSFLLEVIGKHHRVADPAIDAAQMGAGEIAQVAELDRCRPGGEQP